jgi:hypothetical protein
MTHREAPSCNGSQQESQKLTASDTVETPSIHVDPSTGMSWVTLEDYNNLHERLDGVCEEMAKIAVIVGRSKDGTGLDVDWFELADDVKSHREEAPRQKHDPIQYDGYCHCLAPAHRCDYPRCPAGRGEPEPSCNGSLQESQKLTGDAAGETTTPRTDAFSNVIAAQGTAKPAWYEFARGLERESSSLKAQLEGFRKDAERYRWLRLHSIFANDSLQEIWFDAGVTTQPNTPTELDAAIDSALHHPK